MTLTASCGAIYFTETPVENIITLTWQVKEGGEAPAPCSSVIFKVKSSAPKLFYVHPRYGALLLADAAGRPRDASGVQVTFGLRPVATDALSDVAATTAPPTEMSPVGGGGNGYHERIVIESLYIPGDRVVYERLSQGLAAGVHLSDLVRGVWDAVAGGAHSAVRGGPISLKVYTDGVTTDAGRKGEGVVVVPPTARLVRPSLREQISGRLSGTLAHGGVSAPAPASASAAASDRQFRGTEPSELRALKLGIDALRHEPNTAPAAATEEATYNSSSRNIPRPRSSHAETDILMRMPQLDAVAPKGSKDGFPLLMVLAAMFCTYVITMLLWRTI
ncbi:uncharacterized protein Tco025E_09915 [Trypanosoma conorhini]|uniref:Uncharacterized protein n=1 Tax=Trypanosoma conorhini TaxID=83891 RepID=A0A3R7R451_9TRYP|nr:uncharacterized protein Tco025E_09915 [Trypanosoma conorhini]RNE95783.1 hypothetical protein Tco025E_09915 [Trypanosoma conorhini]